MCSSAIVRMEKKSGCVNYLILVWKKIDTDFFFREMYDFNFITTCKFALELGFEVQPEILTTCTFACTRLF